MAEREGLIHSLCSFTPAGRALRVQTGKPVCRTLLFISRVRMLSCCVFLRASWKKLQIDGGEGGIRTLEGLQTLAGFQDQCIQPLCHLSGAGFCAANCACKRTETQYICLRGKNASELLNKSSRKTREVTDINTNYVLAIPGRCKLCRGPCAPVPLSGE